MKIRSASIWVALLSGIAFAQSSLAPDPAAPSVESAKPTLTIPAGTRVPLTLKQAISTKTARDGDPVYAQTAFPFVLNERIVIPAGTYTGEVRIPGGNIPIVLDSTGTEVHVRLGDLSSPPKTAFILPVTRRPGEFLGSIPGPIGDTAFERFSDSALLDLRTIGGELKGTISASTWPDEPRMHFLLSYAVSLKRES